MERGGRGLRAGSQTTKVKVWGERVGGERGRSGGRGGLGGVGGGPKRGAFDGTFWAFALGLNCLKQKNGSFWLGKEGWSRRGPGLRGGVGGVGAQGLGRTGR